MKILTIGRTGQLGTELARQCPSGWTMTSLGRDDIDLTDPVGAAARVADADADLVINAGAYTAVDQAEAEPDLARVINAQAPGVISASLPVRPGGPSDG